MRDDDYEVLKNKNVKSVLNLLTEPEMSMIGKNLSQWQSEMQHHGIKMINIPVKDMNSQDMSRKVI